VASDARERVTIDLRGLGTALQARAMAEHSTSAAIARRALVAWLQSPVAQAELFAQAATPLSAPAGLQSPAPADGAPTKVTLRLPAHQGRDLAGRARQAGVTQGAYVAGLLNGLAPSPQAPDHGQAVTALLASTDQLAVLAADINGFMRALRRGSAAELEPYRASVMSLVGDVRAHLAAAARLMAELQPGRKPAGPARSRPFKPRRST
jgi:hypothetical protein